MVKTKIVDIENLLKHYLTTEYEILEKVVCPATVPGEHYGSIILAVELRLKSKITGEEKLVQMVAKLLPSNEMLRKVFDVYVTFKKEVEAYTQAIPALVEFQKKRSVPEGKYYDRLFPKCYGARINKQGNNNTVDDDAVLLFENLKVQGYYTEDRLKGLDFEAAKVILKDLANFHATPIALKLLKPDVFEKKVRPCLVKNKGLEQRSDIATVFHNSILQGAQDCPDLTPHLEKIKKICNSVLAQTEPKLPPNEPWGTISHSDFWTSNTMILEKQGKYIANKIIDLQLILYNSVLADLIFFLFTSIVNSVLDDHYEEFIKIYYEEFINILKDYDGINLELFSWDEFIQELESVARTEIYHILVMLKPICTERGAVRNTLEDFQDSDWTREDLLGPNHRRKMRETVLSLVKRNWM